ncbi:hypothetical protein G6011_04174 [Alternaria panax]|uniref:Uncharacterized protein n=1 Tax=Alternaria panax TaxID=48097 RepID=A0AAD4NTY7_9PLEO|nr:hypothetical protein G6011_04174 [Alternaria panax]
MANIWTTRTALLTGLVISLLGAFYVYQSPTPLNFSMPHPTSSRDSIPGLEFTLSRTSRSPPTLLVTIKNTSPDTPYTILKWNTPLDSSALNSGVFTITDAESGKEVEQTILQINRKMPPPQDSLVTLAPGTKEEIEIVFDKPWMPKRKPAKYKVQAKGVWTGVWGKYGNEVTKEELYAYAQSPFGGWRFATSEVFMEVD